MLIDPQAIKARPERSLREAITGYVRDAVMRGHLEPGSVLPSSRELARLLETSSPNVHMAFTPLVKEGLITRDRKRGTVVNARPRKLSCVVIYQHHWQLDILSPFQHKLIHLLGQQLQEQGIESRLVVDNFTQYGLSQIREWAETGQIQGVIMPFAGADTASIAAVGRMPVPAAFGMRTDWRDLARQAVAGLQQQGARRVGLISTLERHTGTPPVEHALYTHFLREATAAGLEVRDDWVQAVADESEYLPTPDLRLRFVYDRCGALLDLPRRARPDGLFVFWDDLIAGALLAILERQVAVPHDLKLVLYRNWEIDVVGLPPCVMVGLSVATLAQSLIADIQAQFSGRRAANPLVGYETIRHPGARHVAPRHSSTVHAN